jgi:hypothetical protein
MDTLTFTDPVALLDGVRKYATERGAKIELNDDPMNRRVGYKVGDSISWLISITDLKRASADPTKKDLVELFKTPEGRLSCALKLAR